MSTQPIIQSATAITLALFLTGCGQPPGESEEQSVASLPSCSPQRAAGAVSPFRRALLDTIATTEGTYRADADDGYDITFAYHHFADCSHHPGVVYCSGGLCSDASGRYQFLASTWAGLGYPFFYPNYQDLGAMKLIDQRGVSIPAGRALSYNEFVAVMEQISWIWASLPPGQYGQPSRTMGEAWSIYGGFASHVRTEVELVSVHSGKCMDVTGEGTANGTKIELYDCNGRGSQSFHIVSQGNDVELVNTHSGKCIDVTGEGTANGTDIELYQCNHGPAQLFQMRSGGGGSVFVNSHSGKCLDVTGYGTANGTGIELYTCTGGSNQEWRTRTP